MRNAEGNITHDINEIQKIQDSYLHGPLYVTR